MNENDERDQRGVQAGADTDQAGAKGSHVFVSNGKEHYNHSFRKMVTALVAIPLGSLCIGSIIAYKSYRSDLSEAIRTQAKDADYDKSYTVGGKISNLDTKIQLLDDHINQCNKKSDFVLCYINKGKHCEF